MKAPLPIESAGKLEYLCRIVLQGWQRWSQLGPANYNKHNVLVIDPVLIVKLSTRPLFLRVYWRNKPRGMLGEHEKSL